MERHSDYEWIQKKIDGHGATYSYSSLEGLANINWIFGKNFIHLFYYNIVLWVKYANRNVRKSRLWKMCRSD